MKKIDGKGHHPKVRPYHRRNDKDLKEVRISVCSSLSAWQLAMKRLGICFTASEKNGIGTPSFAGLSLCEAMEQASSATQSVGVGCTDAGGWYVDTSGCGMLQYDDANPPPKNEFTHSVLKVLAILLSLVLVVVASSCNKTPEPTPTPEPTHHYPETIYVPFEFTQYAMPNIDTIRFYAQQPDVKEIIMDLKPMDSLYEYGSASGWTWVAFHRARNMLYERHGINTNKVFGRGIIIGPNFFADTVDNRPGVHHSDSLDLAKLGFSWTQWQH